jgi:hypothetical protein
VPWWQKRTLPKAKPLFAAQIYFATKARWHEVNVSHFVSLTRQGSNFRSDTAESLFFQKKKSLVP